MSTEQEFINVVKQEMQRIGVTIKASYSLRRIADLAIQRGYVPCNMIDGAMEFHVVPLEDARQYVIDRVDKPMTWRNFAHWKAWKDVETVQQFNNIAYINVAS